MYGDYNQYGNDQNYKYDFNSYGRDPKKKGSGDFFKTFLTVLLCVSLSFCAGVGGVIFAKRNLMDDSGSGNQINPAPSSDSLYNDDPEGLLDRSEIEYSPYGSAGEDAFAISEVVRMVEDSVVVINAKVPSYSAWGGTTESISAGSGVIIHENGYILTCYHVIENATEVVVTLSDGVSKYAAERVGFDEASDLAVLKIDPKAEQPLTAAKHGKSGYLVVGEHVVAIGNPLGTLGGTVTDGIISATERRVAVGNETMTLIQTNAAINSGNSGGGLFNLKGELIGIVNAKYAESGVEGLAFAIPIDSAYEVECDLIEFGYVRGIVDHGLTMVEVNSDNVASYYYRYGIQTLGLYIVSSNINSDLKNKDRIVSVNGSEIKTVAEFDALIETCKVGDVIKVVYERSSQTYETAITLEEYIPDNSIDFQN